MTPGSVRMICLGLLALAALPARAAERAPLPDPAPISYARACDAYGAGYFTVPGSDMCLRLGGMALGELDLRRLPLSAFVPNPGEPVGKRPLAPPPPTVGGGAALGLSLEAHLPTEAGDVTGYISATTAFGAGLLSPNPSWVYWPGANLAGYNLDAWRNLTRLDQAYLKFAGFTAGRTQSIFDFYADAWNFMPLRGSNALTEGITYRFEPTPSVSVAAGFENNAERRNLIGQAVNPAGKADYTGGFVPDAVASLRVDLPFGAAQISGAAHELHTRYAAPPSVAPSQPDAASSPQWGFAAQGGLKVNLPNLSPADAMILQATYARGASAYLTGDNQPIFGGVDDFGHPGIGTPRLGAAPGLTTFDYDCVVTSKPFGRCDKSSGYAIVAAFKHFWTPTVSSSLFGSFFGMDYSSAARTGAPGVTGATNYHETTVGANLTWTPLKDLMVGGEIDYTHGKSTSPHSATSPTSGSTAWPSANEWSGRIRVQHNF